MTVPLAKPVHTVQVRELVEFVLKEGNLGGDNQFMGADRALAGIRGHQKIQRSRPEGYQTEIPIEYTFETPAFTLKIRGRIDGLLATEEQVILEEIKTIQGRWDGQADPLHWAQAKLYAYVHAQKESLASITVRLVYLELETGRITELTESLNFTELSAFFEQTTDVYLEWLHENHEWCVVRDQSIRKLPFPFPVYRRGQRELAVAAYRVLANGGRLFLAAPTGIGKTMSTLFPAVKALGEAKLERIFYLTARTVGRTIAEKACSDMRQAGLRFRSVTLTAKEKICVQAGHPCDPLTCPLAIGYFDRIKPALREALSREEITRSVLERVATQHQVCPFELSLDVSSWADAIICDYNYVFDPRVFLRRHFAEPGGAYGFLIDEAHNLPDRAREMFSASLEADELNDLRKAVKTGAPRCAKAFGKLRLELRRLCNPEDSGEEPPETSDPATELNLFPASTPGAAVVQSKSQPGTSRELPAKLIELAEVAEEEAEAWLVKNESADFREDLLGLYFRLRTFRRTAELYDEHYVTLFGESTSPAVRLFCLDPSHLLQEALMRGKAAVFFSATLTPLEYYRTLLGGVPEDPVMQLSSPFPPENLAVLVQDRIQTTFKGRTESLGEVVETIAAMVQGRAGNYLVYFPSYQYLNSVLQEFQIHYPAIPVLVQKPGMTEQDRDAFLAAFAIEHGEILVGFAVMGGIFGEGIDLVGERLIGAAIVGVGLPQLCTERDLIRDYFQDKAGSGFEYAYTFPGMNRVLQAVGRVIRSDTDRGVVLLIDTRFNETRYRRLFPPWWKYARVRHAASLREAIQQFWEQG